MDRLYLNASELLADPYWRKLVAGLPPEAALLAYYTSLGIAPEDSAALIEASHAPPAELDQVLTEAAARLITPNLAGRVLAAIDISDLWAIRLIKSIAENSGYGARARLDAVRMALELRDRIPVQQRVTVNNLNLGELDTLKQHISEEIQGRFKGRLIVGNFQDYEDDDDSTGT